jgi:hypothetical protein
VSVGTWIGLGFVCDARDSGQALHQPVVLLLELVRVRGFDSECVAAAREKSLHRAGHALHTPRLMPRNEPHLVMFVERFFTLLADAPRIRLSMLTLSASMHTLSGGQLTTSDLNALIRTRIIE